MKTQTRILVIEDDASEADSIVRLLESEDYTVTLARRGDAGFELAQKEDFDVVVTDLRMPGLTGLQIVKQLHATRPRLPIILMTAFGTTETAIEATKQGAFDYVVKPFDIEDFLRLVAKATTSSRLMKGAVELGQAASERDAIVGTSRAMQEVYKEIGRVAARPVTVLIRGETGSGKELVARALYQHSERADRPFIAVNCAAIPETLLESELFGHERGAFTGAENRRIGRFEQANGGTLFLDEIGDMTMFTQSKLLRVLQDNTIQRIGGRETIPVDVRVIAATHRDLEKALKEGQFREDLFYRLSAFVIKLPPLRERAEDIPLIVPYFLRRLTKELGLPSVSMQPEAITWLQRQTWPGNVRQLTNTIRQALVESRGFPIGEEHLRSALNRSSGAVPEGQQSLPDLIEILLRQAQAGETTHVHARVLEQAERMLLERAFELAEGDEAQVGRWLNLPKSAIKERVKRLALKLPGARK